MKESGKVRKEQYCQDSSSYPQLRAEIKSVCCHNNHQNIANSLAKKESGLQKLPFGRENIQN